jgi:hypothetical protein
MTTATFLTRSVGTAVAVLVIGCAGTNGDRVKTYPVSGNIYVNGLPAAGAVVECFALDDPALLPLRPHAIAGPDGTFKLTTYKTGDGAPAGSYALTVKWPTPPRPNQETGVDRLKGRYADPKRPARRIKVQPSDNDLETIDLK